MLGATSSQVALFCSRQRPSQPAQRHSSAAGALRDSVRSVGIDAEGAFAGPPAQFSASTNLRRLPSGIASRTSSGDFVAMMQGGAVDHQRAIDAVSQVALQPRRFVSQLTAAAAQLCERIDSTLDIRCELRQWHPRPSSRLAPVAPRAGVDALTSSSASAATATPTRWV